MANFLFTAVPNVSEELETAVEEYDDFTGDWNCSVVLRLAWNDRQAFYADILGRPWPYFLDVEHPPIARRLSMVTRGCAGTFIIAGKPGANEGNLYEHALVRVDYTNSLETSEISEVMEVSSSFNRLTNTKYKWLSDDRLLTPAENPGVFFFGGVITRTITAMDKNFHISMLELQNSVNVNPYTFDVLRQTFNPETLLYAGSKFQTKRVGFIDTLKVVQKFHYREIGWNRFFRETTALTIRLGDQIVDEFDAPVDPYNAFDWVDLPRDSSGNALEEGGGL